MNTQTVPEPGDIYKNRDGKRRTICEPVPHKGGFMVNYNDGQPPAFTPTEYIFDNWYRVNPKSEVIIRVHDPKDVQFALEMVSDRYGVLKDAGNEPSPGVRFPINVAGRDIGWWKVRSI